MTAPHGVSVTTCWSCRARIWFGLVWGTPCPMDEHTDPRFEFATTGHRRMPVQHTVRHRRYVELDAKAEGRDRYRIHRCDQTRRERLATAGRMNPATRRP